MPKTRLRRWLGRRSSRIWFWRKLRRSRIPFLAQVPAVVVFVGLAVAFTITLFGVVQLREQDDEAASLRSKVLASTLAERLRAGSDADRAIIVERAARRSGAEILLARQDGTVLIDGSLGAPSRVGVEQLLIAGTGETTTANGRSRFAATPLGAPSDDLAVLVFIATAAHPFGESSLLRLTAFFALMLTAIAALAAYGLARSVQTDVAYVKNRIVEMARPDGDPAGELIPVRTADVIGALTNAFNGMVERFTAAEHAYRHDLEGALAYERERSEFLAALSHELRTPLNVILGFTDVLLSGLDGPLSDDAIENLSIVRRSGEHLQRLINDVLDLSALESGQLHLVRKDTDVHAVASDVVRESRVTALSKGLALDLHGEHVSAWTDPVRLRQIIDNLVSNAIKFTSRGGVTVRVMSDKDQARLTVTDTGPGIAEQEQARIFEEFQQGGDLSTQRGGAGLGLAITLRLVQMHGGRIELQSKLGAGSSFTVLLPMREPKALEPEPTPADTEPPPKAELDASGAAA
jgi:signal transduction histidine kinase